MMRGLPSGSSKSFDLTAPERHFDSISKAPIGALLEMLRVGFANKMRISYPIPHAPALLTSSCPACLGVMSDS